MMSPFSQICLLVVYTETIQVSFQNTSILYFTSIIQVFYIQVSKMCTFQTVFKSLHFQGKEVVQVWNDFRLIPLMSNFELVLAAALSKQQPRG